MENSSSHKEIAGPAGISIPVIGTLNESPLHLALKQLYARPGDRFEVPLEGFVIDLVRDGELVEVQTGSFFPLRPKLERLLDHYPMRVVHPIICERRIHYSNGKSRRSPRHKGTFINVFENLVSFPTLLTHPNFSLDVLLCREEKRDRQRFLVEVVERLELRDEHDVAALIPLPEFTLKELALKLKCSRSLAENFVYCLKTLGLVAVTGKQGRAYVYTRTMAGLPGSTSATAKLAE